MRELGVVHVVLLDRVDVKFQRRPPGVVVVVVVPLAGLGLDDRIPAHSVEHIPPLLAHTGALPGEPQADPRPDEVPASVLLGQFPGGGHQLVEGLGRLLRIQARLREHLGVIEEGRLRSLEEGDTVHVALPGVVLHDHGMVGLALDEGHDVRRVRREEAGVGEVETDIPADVEEIRTGVGRDRRGQLLLHFAKLATQRFELKARVGLGVFLGRLLVERLDLGIAGPDAQGDRRGRDADPRPKEWCSGGHRQTSHPDLLEERASRAA